MNWRETEKDKLYELLADGEPLSKIIITEKPGNPVNKFIIKTLLNKVVLGKDKLNKLEKKQRSWYKLSEKRFPDIDRTQLYLYIKKDEVIQYIKNTGII